MAIIVDTNCFACVFSRNSKDHTDFAPVLDWILEGHGFLVFGGSKYWGELTECKKYLHFVNLLKKAGKVYVCDGSKVDEMQKYYEEKIVDPDFDDPHLPAIVRVSKCRLICTKDIRSKRFVTSRDLYPQRFHIPQYYSSKKDARLLIDANIDSRLMDYRCLLNKEAKEAIYGVASVI